MNRILLCILALCCSCSAVKPIDTNSQKSESIVKNTTSVVLYPGKVSYVEFPINLKEGKWNLNCKDKRVPFFVKNKLAKAYLSETYFSNLKKFKCYFDQGIREKKKGTNISNLVLEVHVKEFQYKSERLNVDKRRVILSKKDQLRVKREREITSKVYQNTSSFYLFDRPFNVPLGSYVTSHYGTRRLFNNHKKSSHLGNDFRAAVGVPIPVANRGRIVFTGNLFYSGNVVIVDHGMDIFTLYGHLSKIMVTEGTLVNKGDILGLAGRTGRVSGPHLHWGVRINGNAVDGFSLVEASRQHFDSSISSVKSINTVSKNEL